MFRDTIRKVLRGQVSMGRTIEYQDLAVEELELVVAKKGSTKALDGVGYAGRSTRVTIYSRYHDPQDTMVSAVVLDNVSGTILFEPGKPGTTMRPDEGHVFHVSIDNQGIMVIEGEETL